MYRARYLIIFFLVFYSIILCSKASAQPVNCNSDYFLNSYPDKDSTFLIYDMVLTSNNDVIVSGTITKRAIFPTEMHGVIFRIDKNGNKLWELYLSGAGRIFCRRIIRLQDNNFLLAGFDQSGPYDFLMKISLDGNVLWRKNILKTQSFGSSFNGLKEADDGSLFLASDFEEEGGSKGILFSKFDKSGNLLISKFNRLNSSNTEITVRDMVIIGGKSYIIGLIRQNNIQQKIHKGFLISMENSSCNLEWTRLYDFSGADQDFFQVFSYINNRLCILGRNPVSAENSTNILICDTTGNVENNSIFSFGQKSEYYGAAAMDESGNILYGNENKQSTSTDLAIFLVNPVSGIQWAKHYPTLNAYPFLNKLLYNNEADIYASGRIFSNGVFSFIGKFSSGGDMKCGAAPMDVQFGNATTSISTISFSQVQKLFTIGDGLYPPASDQISKGKEVCQPAGACTNFSVLSLNAVCKEADILKLLINRNAGCTGNPDFSFNADSLRLLKQEKDTAEFLILKTGTIKLLVSLNGLCETLYDTLTIFAGKRSGNVFPSGDTILCSGSTLILEADSGYNSYLWQDGTATSAIAVNQPGLYHVVTTDLCGFSYSDSIFVAAAPPLNADLGPDRELCGTAAVVINAPSGLAAYLWSNNTTGQTLTVTSPGTYWLQVQDENACVASDTLLVTARDCISRFYIPTAFTPNNDGLNDEFKPIITGVIHQYKFIIFNRWGEIVFSSTEPHKGWDGRYKGKKPDGNVFTWSCIYQLQDNPKKSEKGQVYLIR